MRALARFPVRSVMRGGRAPEQRPRLPPLASVQVAVALPTCKGGDTNTWVTFFRAPLVCGVALYTDGVLLRQSRLAWHAMSAAARFIRQPLQTLLQKPLHPLVHKAAADAKHREAEQHGQTQHAE